VPLRDLATGPPTSETILAMGPNADGYGPRQAPARLVLAPPAPVGTASPRRRAQGDGDGSARLTGATPDATMVNAPVVGIEEVVTTTVSVALS